MFSIQSKDDAAEEEEEADEVEEADWELDEVSRQHSAH